MMGQKRVSPRLTQFAVYFQFPRLSYGKKDVAG